LENRKEIAEIDKKIDSGAFATISLLIDDRLYVANVGTVHCFVCTYNKRTFEKRVTTMESAHTLTNISEMLRLADLKADVQEALLKGRSSSGGFITYTRCLGDFKHKLYYHEQPQFK
jgi:serine/threonine protein phosphatase PrpC